MYSPERKATPQLIAMTNQVRRRVCGRVFAGFACVRGVWLPLGNSANDQGINERLKKNLTVTGTRGSPHPPAICYANPTYFFYFLGYRYGIFANLWGRTGVPNEKTPAGRTNRGNFANLWGDRGGYRVYPGRTWSYGSVIFPICQPPFYFFCYF